MDDVVLHYKPGSAAGLSCLLETTEKLLESFPCRRPPVFSPWFPSAADRHLPIRPAKPAPVIRTHTTPPQSEEPEGLVAEDQLEEPGDAGGVCEPPDCLLPEREVTKDKAGVPAAGSSLRRSWSVFAQKGILPRSSRLLSQKFLHMVSRHRLHLHQRAKWVISRHNAGPAGDIEKVWTTLSRSVQTSKLPTCNANIQRELAEVWVFCDLLHAEQVGRFLKEELQLVGRIHLVVHRRGDVMSL